MVRQQLLALLKERYMEPLVRSREKSLEHDEKPSKECCSFERDRCKRLQIRVVCQAGKEVTGQQMIGEAINDCYTELLWTAALAPIGSQHPFSLAPRISKEVTEQINDEITPSKIQRALASLSARKSP